MHHYMSVRYDTECLEYIAAADRFSKEWAGSCEAAVLAADVDKRRARVVELPVFKSVFSLKYFI